MPSEKSGNSLLAKLSAASPAKRIACAILAGLAIAVCIIVMTTGLARHGFLSEHPALSDLRDEDIGDPVLIGTDETRVCSVSPAHDHVIGLEIALGNFDAVDRTGHLFVSVQTDGTDAPASGEVDFSCLSDEPPMLDRGLSVRWLHVPLNHPLSKGVRYDVHMSSSGCESPPEVVGLRHALPEGESKGSTALVFPAWDEPDLSLADRSVLAAAVLGVGLFGIATWLGLVGRRRAWQGLVVLAATTLMFWNFETSIMCSGNDSFDGFQRDSDSLVLFGMDTAVNKEVEKASPYGLGRIEDMQGARKTDDPAQFPNEGKWHAGYSWDAAEVVVGRGGYTEAEIRPGRSIRFANGESRTIESVSADGDWLVCSLSGDPDLSLVRCGSLASASIVTEDGHELPHGIWVEYRSAYGLQGKVARVLSKAFPTMGAAEEAVRTVTAACTAIAMMAVTLLIARKYGAGPAACHYAVMLLSPWVTNFGDSLYWQPALWMAPAAIGLACSLTIGRRPRLARGFCYLFAAIMLFAKCLCGYEYVSSILLMMVTPLTVDALEAFAGGDRRVAGERTRQAVCLGMAGLVGFALAIMLHALLRGGGSVGAGLTDIISQDVMRRTNGGSLDAFDSVYWPSLNASGWDVLKTYLGFRTELVAGVPGSVFPVSLAASAALVAGDAYRRRQGWVRAAGLLVMGFLVAASWFLLAKSHSYIHTHMNYVLWYFVLIPVCTWILVAHVRDWVTVAGLRRRQELS